jgi:hypothetical protein
LRRPDSGRVRTGWDHILSGLRNPGTLASYSSFIVTVAE